MYIPRKDYFIVKKINTPINLEIQIKNILIIILAITKIEWKSKYLKNYLDK